MGRALAIALVASTTLISATPAWSQYRYTPDITVDLSGTVVTDESVADDDLLGTVGLEDLGTLPPSTEVDAYEPIGSEHLFSLDTTVLLSGSLTATPNSGAHTRSTRSSRATATRSPSSGNARSSCSRGRRRSCARSSGRRLWLSSQAKC